MNYKQFQFDSFRVLTIQTDHFKNCHIDVHFLDSALDIDMPTRSLLTSLMSFTTKRYQTKRELLIALEGLYNSDFSSSASRIGNSFVSSFSFDFINPCYVSDSSYLKDCVSFLCEALLQPNITDGRFDERSMAIMKERKHRQIDSYKERALSYAFEESRQELFKDSSTSKSILGTHEELDAITGEDLAKDYQRMFQNSTVDIMIIGDLDMDFVGHLFETCFQKKSIVEKDYAFWVDNPIYPFKEIEMPGKYVQTQLLMYLQFEQLTHFERFVVSCVYNHILGNANQSDKLSRYLRIENPLSYYSGIRFVPAHKYLLLYTGLNYEHVEEAKEAMKKALREMQEGEIDEEYLEIQKEKLISNICMSQDSEYYLLDNYYFHELLGEYLPEDLKEQIKKVTIQDIKTYAKKFSLSMVYVLKESD